MLATTITTSSRKKNKHLYLFGVASTILAYWINNENIVSLSLLTLIAGVLLSIFDVKRGCLFFFVISLAFSDFTYEGVFGAEMGETVSLGGIYMASVGGSTLMVYWSIINLTLLTIKRSKWAYSQLRKSFILKILLIIAIFSFVGLIGNLFTTADDVIRTAVSDIRIFVNIIVGFLTVSLLIENKDDLIKFFNLFILIFLVQISLTVVSSYNLSKTRDIVSFFTGTDSYLLGVAFVYLLYSFSHSNKIKGLFSNKNLNLIGMLLIVLSIFVVASRGKMLGLAYGVFAFLIYSRKFLYIGAIPLLIICAIYIVQSINPNFYDYFIWKFTTFNPMEAGGESSKIRYISFVNIINELLINPYYFVFGKGLGGYFETNFMSFGGIIGEGAFKSDWIREGKFYKPHGIFLYSLLKYGVVMSLVLFISILQYCYKGLKTIRNCYNDGIKGIALSILINMPFFFLVIYSSKLQLIFGMLLAFSHAALVYTKIRQIHFRETLNSRNSEELKYLGQ